MGRKATTTNDVKITVVSPLPPTDEALIAFWGKLQEISMTNLNKDEEKKGGA